jgi:hypothetical protein
MDPKEFQQTFLKWVEAVKTVTNERIVAIDGKTLHRSHEKNKSLLHLASAWALENKVVLGQVKTTEMSKGCQKEIVKTVIDKGADYVLSV